MRSQPSDQSENSVPIPGRSPSHLHTDKGLYRAEVFQWETTGIKTREHENLK